MTEIELLRKQVAELMDRVRELEKGQPRPYTPPSNTIPRWMPLQDWTWRSAGTGAVGPALSQAQNLHRSDCAVNNGPAYEPGACDCGAGAAPPKLPEATC